MQRCEFHRRMVVEAFDTYGRRGEPWSQVARRFLELWVEATVNEDANRNTPEIQAAGKTAIGVGCDDPLVTCLYGCVLATTAPAADWLPYVEKACDGLAESKYGVVYRMWAADSCHSACRELGRHDSIAQYRALTCELLLKMASSDDYRPHEQRLLLSHISPVWTSMTLNEKRQWFAALETRQGVRPWLKNTMKGKWEIDLAWLARGGGWASDVSDEGWSGFGEHLRCAYDALLAAWQSDQHAPEPADELITVAMAGGTPPDQDVRYWFDRAVSAQFDFGGAYARYRQALLPRWGGSVEELYAFGEECLATKRFDSWVPFELFRTVRAIAADYQGDSEFFAQPGVYEDLTKMIDGYLAEPGMSHRHGWFRSLGAAIAWRCRRWEEGRRYADQIGDAPHANAFSELDVTPELALGEIDARSGEWSPALDAADRLFDDHSFDPAASAYRKVLAAMPKGQRAAAFVADRLRNAETLQRFHAGEWVDVTPDLRGSQWTVIAGDWTIDDQGWLTGHSSEKGLRLLCELRFGKRLELRGDARFNADLHDGDNVGVFFGPRTLSPRQAFHFFKSPPHTCLWEGSRMLAMKEVVLDMDVKFHVQRWDNELSTCLDGHPMHVAVSCRDDDDDDVTFGVGGRYCLTGSVIRLRNLQVRLLSERPKPPEIASDAVAANPPPAASSRLHFHRTALLVGSGALLLSALAWTAFRRKRYVEPS